MTNPFKVYSPEDMTASQLTKLFVPVAEGFEIDGPEHVFIHGHRGCGKSMMLRLLTPDCQALLLAKPLSQLPFLGIYATVKATGLDVTEYERLKNQYAGPVLAEHSLVTFLGAKVFHSLIEHSSIQLANERERLELQQFISKKVFRRLGQAKVDISDWKQQCDAATTAKAILQTAVDAINEVYGICADYLKRSSFESEYRPYDGPLLGYREFLFPILSELTQLSFMPSERPVYFLLDDADNLNLLQTQVLNSWIAIRSGNKVAFKISTQLAYKTYLTRSGQRIEAAHDFREIHASSIHTGASSSSRYPQWVSNVVQRRLSDHSINVVPDIFFPVDEAQEERIKEIGSHLKADWETKGTGYRPNDDAYRYARADYIKSLGGASKQQSNYRYAGFSQLVHISSGIIRFFLDNAAEMYAKQQLREESRSQTEARSEVTHIDPTVQDEVVREAADQLMFGALDKLEQEAIQANAVQHASDFKKLRNLIRALGGIFQEILLSNRSERRVFSIALSDDPPEEVMAVLRLGVEHGYFYEAAIGSKEGKWRTRRYVLTRRLAPHFKLDPMGFSGYLFVTSELLAAAIDQPKRAIQAFKEERLGYVVESSQLHLEI